MKKMRLCVSLFVLVTIIFCYPSSSLAKDTITWLSIDFPPLRITKGEQKGEGIGDLAVDFLKMLSKGHIDYIIEYPSQVIYISRELDLDNRFYTIGLEEAPSYTVSHVVCPKTEWGKQVIQKVNIILEQGRPTRQYRSFIERWVDEGRIVEFREVYKDFLNLKE